MIQKIKERIESIRRGEVPEGYKRTKVGIIPNGWGEGRLKLYFKRLMRKNTENNTNVHTISAQYGLISQQEVFNKSEAGEDKRSYYLLLKGDFAYNKSYSSGYPYGAIKRLKDSEKGIVSPLYICLVATNGIVADYFAQYFEVGLLNREIHSFAQEGARNHGLLNISVEDFFNSHIVFAPEAEQQKIAEILQAQDKVIELKEKLLVQKQQQKKYLMQQLLTGKIRLPGFTGEWRQYILGDIGSTYTGLSGKLKSDFGCGEPYIPYKNVYTNSVVDTGCFELVKLKSGENQNKVVYGDILFTISSETLDEVGMSSVLLDSVGDLYLNSFCLGFRLYDFNRLLPIYAVRFVRGQEFLMGLNAIAQGITRINLTKKSLIELRVTLPPIEEQTAIAEVLSTADAEIGLLKKDIEQEKLKKKSLMQLLLTGIVRV